MDTQVAPSDKEIHAAHYAVYMAVKNGVLVRGSCEFEAYGVCRGPIDAHHEDYAKPLDVRWLCRRHHRRHHQGAIGPGGPPRVGRTQIAVYFPPDLEARLRDRAEADGRSLSNEVFWIVKQALDSGSQR